MKALFTSFPASDYPASTRFYEDTVGLPVARRFDGQPHRFTNYDLGITDPREPGQTLDRLMQQDWVVYSRPGPREPEQVLDYLARYTHRTAISNARLLSMDGDQVCFRYKDYRDHDRHKVMALQAGEFIRRFLQHVLPKGLMRIRHYGFLANSCRRRKLALIRTVLACAQATANTDDSDTPAERFAGYPCTRCGQGMLRITAELPPLRWEGG